MFMVVLVKWILGYLVDCQIGIYIQKVGILGFFGCVKYMSVINQLIDEVKEGKKNLVIVW